MPYKDEKGGGTCGKTQWAVLNADTGKTVACHSTKESANKQLAALAINVTSKESAEEATTMSKPLTESVNLTEAATTTESSTGVLEVEFITPGWGSSGYYSTEVLEAAAPLFKVGTQMFFDHPSESERHDRPARSVRDIGAILVEAGQVNAATGGIRGKVKVVAPYRELLTDEAFVKNIGVSIRASATDITVGEAEGRTGPIIEGLAEVQSVDFVTKAGRGGKVLQVLESARHAVIHEATASDRHQQLQAAVRAAYDGPGKWVYVRDHDADQRIVWFDISAEGPTETWQQGYDVGANDVDITLTGAAVPVSALTKYVPVARPGSTTPTTEESEEDTMGNISIEEAEHRRLTEAAGRVDALQQENDTLKAENTSLKESAADRTRRDRAIAIIGERAEEAGVEFTPREVKGFLADITLTESGDLDETAFARLVDEDAAGRKAKAGAGQVHGFGNTSTPVDEGDATPADLDKAIAEAFGRPATQVQEA